MALLEIITLERFATAALNQGCFAAGTLLWTPDGYRKVEDLQPGEYVYSRTQYDPDGVIEAKVIEEKFERTGRILHLHLENDALIRTTPEHPFYVRDLGWTEAGALQSGDVIRTDTGWVAVEELLDTTDYETVYNIRVADHHTYFVGEAGWGWSVWAHNEYGFLSGLKVVEAVVNKLSESSRTLSSADRDTILNHIRKEGKFGAVGDLQRVVYEITTAIIAGGTTTVAGTLTSYFARRNVKEARANEERWITGGPMGGWINYLNSRTGGDALGKTLAQYEADYIASGGDPTSPITHGHHIVYKDGADKRNPIMLERSRVAAREARDILLYYGINPYRDRENLVFAPKFPHEVATIEYIRDQLKASFEAGISKNTPLTGVIAILQRMAERWIAQSLPGMQNAGGTS